MKKSIDTSNMLTIKEVSQLLQVHSNTLRRWSDQGVIKACRIGPRGDRRFRPEDVAVLVLVKYRDKLLNESIMLDLKGRL